MTIIGEWAKWTVMYSQKNLKYIVEWKIQVAKECMKTQAVLNIGLSFIDTCIYNKSTKAYKGSKMPTEKKLFLEEEEGNGIEYSHMC